MGVGFADIVNYTRQSRSLTRSEVGRLVDRFEERALEIISAHGGRIIKTIGDEVLFVADEPEDDRAHRARADRGGATATRTSPSSGSVSPGVRRWRAWATYSVRWSMSPPG